MADTCTFTHYNSNNSNDDDQQQPQQQQQQQKDQQRSKTSTLIAMSMSTPLYELQHVFDQYKSHPELLKLILTSKVEEDKRRTEEAKLRSKELDYYLQHESTPPSTIVRQHQHQNKQHKMSIPSTSRSKSNSKQVPDPSAAHSTDRHHHVTSIARPTSPSPDQIDSTAHYQQRRHSAATAMLSMGRSVSPSALPTSLSPLPLPTATLPDQVSNIYSSDEDMDSSTTIHNNAYSPPVTEGHTVNQEETPGKRRKRREMLTKIVETRDFPYMDNYFWRNNGNTTQKKTGCRSIYYKCSNSNKGCQVNKTVTAKQNGEYLIKYRGNHMAECGMVERVRDL